MANLRALLSLSIVLLLLSSGCLSSKEEQAADGSQSQGGKLALWSTFEVDSKEEATFLSSLQVWVDAHPTVDVEVVPKPFYEVVQSYKVAAIGGEAPDLMRISNDQLGSIAPVRVDGYQLLEDLRPWLSPVQRQMWDPIALQSMRYENDLLALLPIVDETGQRMSPMVGYKGWAVSE